MNATLKIYQDNELVNTITSNSELEAVKMKLALYEHYYKYKEKIYNNYSYILMTQLNGETLGTVWFTNNCKYVYEIQE